MNLSIKSLFLLIGLLGAAQLNAMTPEDRKAREERVRQLRGQFKSNHAEEAEADQQSESLSVLAKRKYKQHSDEPDRKKRKSEEEKNEDAAVVIHLADPNKFCGFVSPGLPDEVLSMIAKELDVASYASLSKVCRYFDNFLNDEREIERFLESQIRSRGHKSITGSLCSYFPECMKTSGFEIRDLNGHPELACSVIESSVVFKFSCSASGAIKVLNQDTGELLYTLQGHTRMVQQVFEFSNKKIASCSADQTIKIWDLSTGKCLHSLEGHTTRVCSVIELKSGLLASCSYDGMTKIWNLNNSECLLTLQMTRLDADPIIELSNGALASCSHDGAITIWDIYPDHLSAQQIYLVLQLSKYPGHNEKVKLDAFWTEIYNSLPDYLKERYQNAVELK